ncbi:FAD dependent oxidoreductase family protein, partial [Vibrio parahaemolyticus VPTS-2010]
NRFRILRLLG